MTREEQILNGIPNKNGFGLEIGPSHHPVAPKREGYQVHTLDHLTRPQLIEKYKGHGIDINDIEEVDFVWNGESYVSLTRRPKFYDWMIASHVIEHTPDFVRFLLDCDSVLKDSGVLSLAVPDSRYCFDHFRPITGLAKIIDAYIQKNVIHSPGTVAEYCLNVVSKGGNLGWHSATQGEYAFIHTVENARAGMNNVVQRKVYVDVHAWCFTPHSFRLIIHDLHSLGLSPFKEVSFVPTIGTEFFVVLGRDGQGTSLTRAELLAEIGKELVDAYRSE